MMRYYNDTNMYFNMVVTGQFIGDLRFTEYNSLEGNRYLYQESKLKINHNIKSKYDLGYTNNSIDSLNKDDYLLNKALYRIDEDNYLVLIANEQTGVGSKSDNIKSSIVTDLNSVFRPVIDNSSLEFDNKNELENYVNKRK